MFSNFDFNVIERSWVYLFQTGMVFTLKLTGLAMVGGIVIGTLLAMMRLSKFKVLAVKKYPKAQFPTDEVYGPTPNAQLRLITCGGDFDSAAHSYLDNVVVYAELAAQQP